MPRLLFLFVLLVTALPLRAQKQYVREQQTWLGVFNQTRFAPRWGSWTDVHLRLHEHYVQRLFQGVARIGLTYYLGEDVTLTAGYAYAYNFPSRTRSVGQPEHRPWQQLQWTTRFPNVRLTQRLRLEERFRRVLLANERTSDYDFNYRARYSTALALPLTQQGFGPKGWQLQLSNEVMVNFGKEIRLNYFDQNRFFAGLGYQLTKQNQLQAGYMHLFQQLPAGSVYRNQHTLRVFYFHNFDLRPTPPPVPMPSPQ